MSTPPNLARLIPFAKDHDRLQLALIHIEADCDRYRKTEKELKRLRNEEEKYRQRLEQQSKTREDKINQYVHESRPGNYLDSSGQLVGPASSDELGQSKEQPKTWHDEEMEAYTRPLTITRKRIKETEDELKGSSECVAQKEEILKLIEELHATAFDGVTPEFPHEYQLQALVQVAEIALKGEQVVLEKLQLDDGLVELELITYGIEKVLKDNATDPCKLAIQQFQKWEAEIDKHFSQHPDTLLPSWVETRVPQFDSGELLLIFFQGVPITPAALISQVRKARDGVHTAIVAIERMKAQAEVSVTKAEIMLDLRRRQLTAARSQILDHVIDPERCPLEQRAERLPDYPEKILIHDLPPSHYMVSRLLVESETCPEEEHMDEIMNSRLNRARRTTPSVLVAARYQPPAYDELEDPELLRRRYEPQVPPVEGATPEPDDGDPMMNDIETYWRSQVELKELASKAREQLGLKSNTRRAPFTRTRRPVAGGWEALGSNLDMRRPGARV
ncbi:hypothetical protein RSOLAG22IIIB_06118 [Rhizoctonia solani]|uniref:Uncharacterized protein n=1 Tax=Rhizoctonia solani TaxID=456999 RepID=A0A0K6GC27_9AGAM|nr:hypothetical protein RSOLAG22IIIB_06118 [Rhizoctonia solani]